MTSDSKTAAGRPQTDAMRQTAVYWPGRAVPRSSHGGLTGWTPPSIAAGRWCLESGHKQSTIYSHAFRVLAHAVTMCWVGHSFWPAVISPLHCTIISSCSNTASSLPLNYTQTVKSTEVPSITGSSPPRVCSHVINTISNVRRQYRPTSAAIYSAPMHMNPLTYGRLVSWA